MGTRPILAIMRIRTGLPLALAAIAMLTACSGGGQTDPSASASPSPTAEASTASQCEQVLSDAEQLMADVSELATRFGSDPLGALASVPGIVDRVTTLGDQVTDPELAAHVDSITSVATTAVEDAQSAIAQGDTQGAIDALSQAATDVQPAVTALQEYCAAQ
ncbi:hypothetical protein SAMN04489720_3079 [Agrococcus jejuensis]|uniref:Uncharacterized protein n=2 Tax=Agrococcus jejuensis TaxID=399736 RepID=A0A1G8GUU2_9MICO|nr:hypothetical protein SAMN04489720_3079 [Agrococcus jejuensis]